MEEAKIASQYLDKAVAEILALGEEVRHCRRCLLYQGCQEPLPGAGHPLADIFLIKGAPTEVEDKTGVAFFGQAGESLKWGLEKAGVDIANLYGTNSLKCFTSGEPSEESIQACKGFLRLELEITQPKVIVLMGPLVARVFQSAFEGEFSFKFKVGETADFRTGTSLIMTYPLEEALRDEILKSRFWDTLEGISKLLIGGDK